MCEVVRSPAKVSWLVVYCGETLAVRSTKREALELSDSLNKKFMLV